MPTQEFKKNQVNRGNILIVDDNNENLRLLSSILNKSGYKVRLAPSGKLAIQSAKFQLPDIILLDIKMPEMDGYEVCRILKKRSNHRSCAYHLYKRPK